MICKWLNGWRLVLKLVRLNQELHSEIAHLEEYAANLNSIIERLERRIEDNAKITRRRQR